MRYRANYDMRVADMIRGLRETKGMSRSELAELVGISPSHIEKIEGGIRNPGMSTYIKILDALEAEVIVKAAPLTVYDVCAKQMKKAIEKHNEEKAKMITNMVLHMSEEVDKI